MASNKHAHLRPERNLAFVDAVLAIILTILVLGIEVPKDLAGEGISLWGFLKSAFADLHAYIASFVAVGTFWVEHTVVSHYTTRGSRTYEWLNLLLLFPLSLLPFLTKLRAVYPSDAIAEFLFGGALVASFLIFVGLWRYAISRELVPPASDPRALRSITQRLLLAAGVSALATIAAVFSSVLGTAIFVCIPLLFFSQRYVDSHWQTGGGPEEGE